MLETPDFRCFGRSEQNHLALLAIFAFHQEFGKYPGLTDGDRVLELAKFINEENKSKEQHSVEEIDEKVIVSAARFAAAEISPQCAFFGGVVAQEIVKFTGKYSPLKQWLHYDLYESLPDGEPDRTPRNSRYDDQILVYGRELQDKLLHQKTFLVGAGALGCELIKAFALMGVGCSPEGKVHVTDNDTIEVSNLNRQFLFRKNNVGQSKSECATKIGQEMNPAFNVKDYQTLVGPDTETVFNDELWDSLNFVVNAVDNVKARLYIDSKCVWYKKPLLESGTLGTKANSQMIIPDKTQCYGDSQDPPEESIPMCTLRNFPNQIEHTIEWGRALFNELFSDHPSDVISYLDKPHNYLKQLKSGTTSAGQKDALAEIKKLVNMKKSADFGQCIEIARLKFEEYFNNSIRNLLYIFPADYKDKEGQPFWSGPKRAPSPIAFDPNDELHAHFVMACANLYAFVLGVKGDPDKKKVAAAAGGVKVPEYVPKKIKVELEEGKGGEGAKEEEEPEEKDDKVIQELLAELVVSDLGVKHTDFSAADFEKDDDSNFHIDFIHAAANLRARNYRITECDR